jgi:tetratricopeptide (TPR) repeat protein
MGSKQRKSRKSSKTNKSLKEHRTRKRITAEKTSIFKLFGGREKKEVKKVSGTTLSGWRLWLFRLIAVTVVPALLFLLIEVTLRLVGYGFPTHVAVKCQTNDRESYCSNVKFSWRFFNPDIARAMDPFVFPAEKTDKTYRIFIMGASAAAGTPDGAFSFGRFLRVMLSQRYPQTDFEVMVVAMPAINSHVVLEIAKDCARHQPDLFIVYLGNNEVVGPYGAGTVFAPLSSNLTLIRLGIKFKSTMLGQLLTNLLGLLGTDDTPKVWGGLQMFLDKQVRADDPRMEIVYRHFQQNLQDICHLANKKKTKIIICTVPGNLKDNPPFSSNHRPNLSGSEKVKWDELYQRGVTFETEGHYSAAVEQYVQAVEIDDSYADLRFRLGRCYWAMGEYDQSREQYIQARELDTLRFRADNRINDIIRDVVSGRNDEKVYLSDVVNVFEQNSLHKTTGEELFYEHVHMNFKGNYLLAVTIFQQVEKILPEKIKSGETARERPLPSAEECARYLAYTDWDKYKIVEDVLNSYIKQPPFTNQLYHAKQVEQMEQQIHVLEKVLSPEVTGQIEGQFFWAIEQNPSDWWLHWNFGEFLEEKKNYGEAARQFRLVLDYMPNRYQAWAKLGLLSGLQGDINTAVNYNLKALNIYPIFPDACFNIGLAYQLQGNLDKAVEQYFKAIQLKPDYARAYNNLGVIFYQQGKIDQATKIYRDGLKFVPDDLDMHSNLGLILEAQGHRDEAIKELHIALKIDPNSAKVHKVLKSIEGRN